MRKHLRFWLGCLAMTAVFGCDGQQPTQPDTVVSIPNIEPTPSGNPNLDSPVGPGLSSPTECSEPRTSSVLPPIVENRNAVAPSYSFDELKAEIDTACASCHLAPASRTGGFWYLSAHARSEVRSNGQKVVVNGIADAADVILKVMSDNRMPPSNIRKSAPQKYEQLQRKIEDWIAAGKPEGRFALRMPTDNSAGGKTGWQSDLGSCIPRTDQIGVDPAKDELFAAATELPLKLSETDLFTLDSLELARKGTLSYNVEYPLWADNAEKGRYVHFPAIWDEQNQKWTSSGAAYNSTTGQFNVPPNTRFYKTFYKAVQSKTGETVFRKIETRIIVVRKAPQEALSGSYKWNSGETEAHLVTIPYRDGTPWKDDIFRVVVDENSGKTRKYAIPGKQRCVECHKGGEDFVLGFTPLQLNRRPFGAAGRDREVGLDEMTQIERFIAAGVLKNISSANELPMLENSAGRTARNVHETRLQGYMVGNCAHCHNPSGFAMKDNKVPLDLREGQLFDFDVRRITRDSTRSSPKYFAKPGDPQQSQIYLRVAATKIGDGGRYLPMPMHTPGDANCKLLNLTAKWIYSLSPDAALAARAETEPVACETDDDFHWVDLDLTWPKQETFVPRRADWKDPNNGMPQKFVDLKEDPALTKLLRTPVAVDFWERTLGSSGKWEPKCDFPAKPQPRKPVAWMTDTTGAMKQPAGELYTVTPGAHYYNTTCAKCHGNTADGRSGLSSNLLTLSGGSIRVANLKDGLFGAGNLAHFDVTDARQKKRNLAGQYLIWMAMEGTRVTFPPEMEPFVGRHKAQMLNQLRERCKNFIATSPQKATERMKDYLAFKDVCFFKNGKPTDKQIQFDPNTDQPLNPAALEAWADKAAINVGWAIYDYLKTEGAAGKWQPAKSECEKVHPVRSGP
jgi:cytochrome c553